MAKKQQTADHPKDLKIRELLFPFIRQEHEATSNIVFLEELAIYGGANRADIAAFNGMSHGYEIKSDRDTLDRLPCQADAYSAIFECATLVTAPRHLNRAKAIVPKWWGIIEVRCSRAPGSYLRRIRESRVNPTLRATAVASLLWRSETLDLLAKLGLDAGVRSKQSEALIARLAEHLSPEKISFHVREILRARGDWRSAAKLRQCDDSSQLPASQLRYRRTPYGNISR